MSEHKLREQTTQSSQPAKQTVLKKPILYFIGFVLVLLATFTGFKMLPKKTDSTQQSHKTLPVSSQEKTYMEVSSKQLSGDTQGAIDLLQKKIDTTKDPLQKADYYVQQATVYVKANDLDKAAAAAKLAESSAQTPSTAHIMALIAEKQGDKALAAKSYKLELQRWGKNIPGPDAVELKQKISDLEK